MKLITIRSQIQGVPERWWRQYIVAGKKPDANKRAIYAKLLSLDTDTCTTKDVADIIGNDTWATPQKCGECNVYHNTIIQIGEPADYESATAYLCRDCIKRALETFP